MSDEKKIKAQNEENNNEVKQEESHDGLTVGMCLGIALGLSAGQFIFNTPTIGMCMGLGIGLCLGTAYDAAKNKQNVAKAAEKPMEEAADKIVAESDQETIESENGE